MIENSPPSIFEINRTRARQQSISQVILPVLQTWSIVNRYLMVFGSITLDGLLVLSRIATLDMILVNSRTAIRGQQFEDSNSIQIPIQYQYQYQYQYKFKFKFKFKISQNSINLKFKTLCKESVFCQTLFNQNDNKSEPGSRNLVFVRWD